MLPLEVTLGADPSTKQAGLFSAILTAFLVQTYPMLQADGTDTTNQLLALSVFTQLRTAGTIVSDTLNKTLTTLADAVSTSFSPSTAARWINILFFLSLVFSLAAALFSILAKQWIREYIKWNSPLALPRENVLVRQIRIEAWEDWQVSMVLSSIPIFLELGMVLFLAGVVILLWTLDDVVAKVITVFVSLFLGAFAAFTVLPIFSRRCPYRSPTAWACYVAFHILTSPAQYLLRYIEMCGQYLEFMWGVYDEQPVPQRIWSVLRGFWPSAGWRSQVKWPGRLRAWRDCDLESRRVTTARTGRWRLKKTNLHDAARNEITQEAMDLGEHGAPVEKAEADGLPDEACSALLTNISEVSHLLRALAWVQQSSQSTRVVVYIQQCLDQVHSDLPPPPPDMVNDWRDNIRMVTIRCILSSILKDCSRHPHRLLLGAASGNSSVGRLHGLTGCFEYYTAVKRPITPIQHLSSTALQLLARSPTQGAVDPSNISPRSLQKCKDLLLVLPRILSLRRRFGSVLRGPVWYIDALHNIQQIYGPYDEGIQLIVFQQACKYGKVTTISQGHQLCKADTTFYCYSTTF